MFVRRRLVHFLAAGGAAVFASGCGAIVDRVSEQAVEEAVERAVEADSGGNVEVEFDDDGIRIETDEGDVTLTADDDGVQIDGVDADGNEFSLDADEDGVVAESDGGGSLDIDSDGTFTATDGEGEVVTGEFDEEDGSVTVEGADGETVFSTAEGIPDEWPSDIPRPDGLSDVQGSVIGGDDGRQISITGTIESDPTEAFDRYSAALVDAGFETSSTSSGDTVSSATFERDDRTLSLSVIGDGAGSANVTVFLI